MSGYKNSDFPCGNILSDCEDHIDAHVRVMNKNIEAIQTAALPDSIHKAMAELAVKMEPYIAERKAQLQSLKGNCELRIESLLEDEIRGRVEKYKDMFDPYIAPEARFAVSVDVTPVEPCKHWQTADELDINMFIHFPKDRSNGTPTTKYCASYILDEIGISIEGSETEWNSTHLVVHCHSRCRTIDHVFAKQCKLTAMWTEFKAEFDTLAFIRENLEPSKNPQN